MEMPTYSGNTWGNAPIRAYMKYALTVAIRSNV